MMFKAFWAFVFSSIAFFGDPASGSDFGVCEKTVLRRQLNTTVTPPEYYKVNVTIRECCYGFMTMGTNCIPMCQNVCINSHCVGNNKCQCNSGYYAIDSFRCLAKCDDPPCGQNMACLAPNRCFCKPDYKKMNESYCEPTCSFTAEKFECINAKCVSPNKCDCFEGFKRISEFQCEPICTSCVNGECIAPDECECREGFEKNPEGTLCEPICDPPCVNAKCTAPNTCECDENFEKYLKSHECLEKHTIKDHQTCLKSCQHGVCSDDGSCDCESRFESYNGKCLEVCEEKCMNGKCLESQCVCPENYKLSDDATACLPICAFEDGHDCIFGSCVSPQICECFEGYRFLDDRNCTCVPMCAPMCVNGICTEDGCICHENFYNISEFECIKNCSEGFKWMYDECMEESSFELFDVDDTKTNDSTTSAEDETTETTTDMTVDEYTENGEDDDYIEDKKDEDDDDSLETSSEVQTTEKDDKVMTMSMSPQLIPVRTCIVIISIITVLITLILISFCVLYRRVNPKNIYYVNERVSNCVYFSKQTEPALALPEVESIL